MPREKASTETTFGYLSTLESADYGYFGGYLIVSPLGRPLEFHCTSPVRPSRAQEILYGPTLQTYLIGEQISGALLKAAKACPSLILVDRAAMLQARPVANSPMALVAGRTRSSGEPICQDGQDGIESRYLAATVDGTEQCPAPWPETQFDAGGYELVLPIGYGADKHAAAALANRLSQHVDLAEPFGRIHEAIREAQRIGGRSVDLDGKAA